MKINELLAHVRSNNMLKGHRLKLFELFCQYEGRLSLRDIQKCMMHLPIFHNELVEDLFNWGVLKKIGFTLHKETGAPSVVYELTGKLPTIPDIVEYNDVVK
jgi:hypothetical protein